MFRPPAVVSIIQRAVPVPDDGTCPALGLGTTEAALMRDVGQALADVAREAARLKVAPFHPTGEGTQATALQIAASLGFAVCDDGT